MLSGVIKTALNASQVVQKVLPVKCEKSQTGIKSVVGYKQYE